MPQAETGGPDTTNAPPALIGGGRKVTSRPSNYQRIVTAASMLPRQQVRQPIPSRLVRRQPDPQPFRRVGEGAREHAAP
jgi:hypothetical protein